jgi:hypothetical protein
MTTIFMSGAPSAFQESLNPKSRGSEGIAAAGAFFSVNPVPLRTFSIS